MLPVVLAALCFVRSPYAGSGDTAILTRLNKALDAPSDKKAWFVRFEQQCPPANIPVWQCLQRKSAPNSKQYGELSFALAYYRKDYNANLRRLTRPSRLHARDYAAYNKEYHHSDWEADWTGWGKTWLPLNLLYLKHHDLTSLGMWLEQGYDGAPAEWNDAELGELWKRHKVDMLKAADASSARVTNLTEALVYGDYDSRSVRKLLREMRGFSHSQDRRVREAAAQVAGQVQRHVKEVDDFDKGQKQHIGKVG